MSKKEIPNNLKKKNKLDYLWIQRKKSKRDVLEMKWIPHPLITLLFKYPPISNDLDSFISL